MPRVKTFLYAVRMLIPGLDPQPIKVGFSSNPSKRRLFYNSGPYPCEWLGVWPGNLNDELAFHMRFIDLHKGLAGEWFLPNEEFMAAITSKIATYQRMVDRQAERERLRLEARAQQEAEQAIKDEESRHKAVEILERWSEDWPKPATEAVQ